MSRPVIFTKEAQATIQIMVAAGASHEAIAERIGCTVGTLKCRCSQYHISLRRPRMLLSKQHSGLFNLQLDRATTDYFLHNSDKVGISTGRLITKLPGLIAQDDLCNAVLDSEQPVMKEAA